VFMCGDGDGVLFVCGDGVGCTCGSDWFEDGIVSGACAEVLPLPIECRPREDEVFAPLYAPLP
jgi:hypothetical protein